MVWDSCCSIGTFLPQQSERPSFTFSETHHKNLSTTTQNLNLCPLRVQTHKKAWIFNTGLLSNYEKCGRSYTFQIDDPHFLVTRSKLSDCKCKSLMPMLLKLRCLLARERGGPWNYGNAHENVIVVGEKNERENEGDGWERRWLMWSVVWQLIPAVAAHRRKGWFDLLQGITHFVLICRNKTRVLLSF